MTALVAATAMVALTTLLAVALRGWWTAVLAGLTGCGVAAAMIVTRRAWEETARRSAWVASHARGVRIDRATDALFMAAMMAAGGALWALTTTESSRGERVPLVAAAVLSLAAMAMLLSLR